MDRYFHLQTQSESITEILKKIKLDTKYFKGRVAVITGGARGFGKELVIGLTALGVKTYFIDISEKESKNTLKILEELGLNADFILGDITDFKRMKEVLDKIIKKHGRIDFLVNNAVKFITKSISELTHEEWQYSHDTNTTAPLLFSQWVLPTMKKNKFGMIINLIAVEGMGYAAAMSSSKASCRSLVISSAAEVSEEDNVSIIGFAPGLVDTPLVFENFPAYCDRFGYDFEDYVLNITNNPGYEGLIPAEHSAAGLIWYMSRGFENNGLICTPYMPLHQAGIIDLKDDYTRKNIETQNISRANEYISEIDKYQKDIEQKIENRTQELLSEKAKTAKLLKKQKKYSKDLEALNAEKTNLLKEIHHRVKNNMQVIISLLKLQSNLVDNEMIRQLFDQSQNRIMAMATVHNMLYESTDFSNIQYDRYLNELCHYLLRSMAGSSKEIRFEVEAKGIALNLDISISLGLVINEIVTNSLKYAFQGLSKGNIYIKFEEVNEFEYKLFIGDDGVGFETIKPAYIAEISTGLGMELIHDLVDQFDGNIEHNHQPENGTHYIISFRKG